MTPDHIPEVAVKGFTWSAAAGWSTFVVITGAIAAIIRAVGLAKIVELLLTRGKERRAEDREEELAEATTIAGLTDRVVRMQAAFAFMANAITVAVSSLPSDDKNVREDAASRARELVALAVSTLGNEDPFVKALDRIASIPPVDRNPGR